MKMKKYLKKNWNNKKSFFNWKYKITSEEKIFWKNISEENKSQELRLKNTDERRNYFLEESKMNWWVESTKRFVLL